MYDIDVTQMLQKWSAEFTDDYHAGLFHGLTVASKHLWGRQWERHLWLQRVMKTLRDEVDDEIKRREEEQKSTS
jgi:hypothetical protein